MGNFDHEQSVSKNAARRGQAFSTAVSTFPLNKDTEIEELKDIENGKYNFTDGWGEISQKLLKEISNKYFDGQICSAIQIRMGGYKGMLLASKNVIGDIKVHTRRSMRKFEMGSSMQNLDLEVVRLATYMPGYLNKQVIIVLWSNGVDIEIFLSLQLHYINILKSYYHLENFGSFYEFPEVVFQSLKIINKKLYTLHARDYPYHFDPFVRPIIRTICFNRLKDIRKKFRIYDEECWNLIGVIDPYDWLAEGEVFIQFNRFTKFAGESQAVKHLSLIHISPKPQNPKTPINS